MANQNRIKGTDVLVRVVSDGQLQTTLTAIRSFSAVEEIEELSEGYLGRTAEDQDEVFKRTSGEAEWHIESAAAFDLIKQIVDRAQQLTPDTNIVINLLATVTYADGSRRRIQIPNVKFGNLPVAFASRKDYMTFRTPFRTGAPYEAVAA